MRLTLFFGMLTSLIGLNMPIMAQSINAPLDKDYYHWVDRYEVKTGYLSPFFFSAVKPYQRKAVAEFADSVKASGIALSSVDGFNLDYLCRDNWEWIAGLENQSKKPLLKHFYKVRSDFYHVKVKDFEMHLNPVLSLGLGRDTEASDVNTYTNTRGLQMRGLIGDRLGFYSFLGENQARYPFYVRDKISNELIVPHEGFWKQFKENGVDFFTARGYISFPVLKNIMSLQFGHDRFFIGNGYRSMILSDRVPPYLFLKLDTKVWKLNYTNLFTQLTADVSSFSGGSLADGRYPKKYMAMHQLSVNVGNTLNLGVFESVVFGADSINQGDFDPGYLNPIIFYRALEQQNGSIDNALLGLDLKWNLFQKLSLYGQFVLDEFLLEKVKAGDGWWGNKFGVQIGGKYIDALGVDNLDLQAEVNIARPYIYSHSSAYGSYSHFRQPLAHPLGANFKELIGIARYQPWKRLNITGKLIYADQGRDSLAVNWGGDILKNNTTRQRNNTTERDLGNFIGQGVPTQLYYLNLDLSYQVRHNLFIDLRYLLRRRESPVPSFRQKTSYGAVHLRWNIPKRMHEF